MHVYVLPVVAPAIVIGLAVLTPVLVAPPLLDVHVAVKFGDVTAPPLLAPGTNEIFSGPVDVVVDPELRERAVGGAGAPTTTAFDAADIGPVPASLVDATRQEYVFPVVAPLTVIGLAAALPVAVTPPSLDVQVALLSVIGVPLAAPSLNETFSGPIAPAVEPDAALTE